MSPRKRSVVLAVAGVALVTAACSAGTGDYDGREPPRFEAASVGPEPARNSVERPGGGGERLGCLPCPSSFRCSLRGQAGSASNEGALQSLKLTTPAGGGCGVVNPQNPAQFFAFECGGGIRSTFDPFIVVTRGSWSPSESVPGGISACLAYSIDVGSLVCLTPSGSQVQDGEQQQPRQTGSDCTRSGERRIEFSGCLDCVPESSATVEPIRDQTNGGSSDGGARN